MKAYHRSGAAREILDHGFLDGTGRYLTGGRHCGVWLADVPLDEGNRTGELLEVNLPDEIFARYEWTEKEKPYREALVPAAVVNLYPRRRARAP